MSALGQQPQRRKELESSPPLLSYLHNAECNEKRHHGDGKGRKRQVVVEGKDHILEEDEERERGSSNDADAQTLRDYVSGVE